jgi:tight adherence protein C
MISLSRLDNRFRSWNAQRRRLPQIAGALPEAIDLWVLVMQAGLDFQVALSHFIDRGPDGPLKEELSILQAEIRTGTSRVEALRHLRERIPLADLRETVQTLIQGIELGSSLTPILKTQANALRHRRAAQAEKRAAVAPLKLMFPLFVFIFPTIFVVLLAPVVLNMMQGGVS